MSQLIEFRVKNFRSLRDEQVLSLVASKDKTLLDSHTLRTGLTAAPHLLKSAVIYGANASGKSNLIKALQFMWGMVLTSARSHPWRIAAQPFRVDLQSAQQPSEFEVSFIIDGVRYQYGFAMTPQRVMHEYLLVYKAFKPQRWFERHFDETTGKEFYEFGAGLKGPKNVWESATRANALFLSMAVQLNSEALRPVFDWFENRLLIVNETSPLAPKFTLQKLKQSEGRKRICDILAGADISIADIEVIQRKVTEPEFHVDSLTGDIELRTKEREGAQLRFSHVTDAGKAVFDLADESSGTRNLLFLLGPVLDVLDKGLTLVVDELDTSLHPHLVQALVRLFHNPDVNTGGAQLIFSTHDTSLLDAYGLFRRDQIWLVEKQGDQSSRLYSFWKHSPRKNEALGRSYLQGRYGAVPMLGSPFGVPN